MCPIISGDLLHHSMCQKNKENIYNKHRGLFITKLSLVQRHRWCVEEQRIFTSFINILVYFITKQWFARFLKTFIRLLPKLSATRTLRLCRSLCLRHLHEIVFILSPPCSPTLCVTFICSRLNLSLHISEEPYFSVYIAITCPSCPPIVPFPTPHYSFICLLFLCYHVFNYFCSLCLSVILSSVSLLLCLYILCPLCLSVFCSLCTFWLY